MEVSGQNLTNNKVWLFWQDNHPCFEIFKNKNNKQEKVFSSEIIHQVNDTPPKFEYFKMSGEQLCNLNDKDTTLEFRF